MEFENRGRRDGGRFGGPREEFDITCAECGQPAKVPFKPKADRPAYCRTCYQKKQSDR